jgi:prepilin-type N-terminal cleavage/methylation domain-containing protein
MKHLTHNISKKQGGYSLVELSIALAIVAVILVGGLMGTRQIIMTNNVNNQLKDAAQVITKITRNFQKQPDTSTVSVNNLAPIGVWPAERATLTGTTWTVRGIMGGSTETVFPNTDTTIGSLSTANQGFLYTIHNIPSAACADLVNGLDSIAYAIYAGNAVGFTPSGAEPTTLATVKAADANQVNQATLATGCSTANARVSVVAVIRM